MVLWRRAFKNRNEHNPILFLCIPVKKFIRITCAQVLAVALLVFGGKSHAAVAAMTPFTSFEAENGTLGGGAVVESPRYATDDTLV